MAKAVAPAVTFSVCEEETDSVLSNTAAKSANSASKRVTSIRASMMNLPRPGPIWFLMQG